VGEAGIILRWNGSGWAPETSGTSDELFAVWGTGTDDVWAAGGGAFEFGGSTLLHRSGGAWQPVATGSLASLRAVTGGNGKIYIAGIGGTVMTK
jgi:hypothetical protein